MSGANGPVTAIAQPPGAKPRRRPRPLLAAAALLAIGLGLWLGLNGLGYVLDNPAGYPGRASFAVVEEGKLYRSGQLPIEDFADIIEEYGIKTVLCVRGGYRNPLQNAWYRRETQYCEQNGVNFVHAPMTSRPDERNVEAIKRFWELVDDPANHPLLVHCERGVDRTGVLSYLYRIHRQDWSEQDARRELMEMGASRKRVVPILDQAEALDQPPAAPATLAD